MSPQRRYLCAAYGAIALAALIATWSQNLAYFTGPADLIPALGLFLQDTTVNPAARSITADIGLFFLAAAIFMVIEARKHGIPFVWAYIAGGLFIAISVTFPLFLIARELKLATPDATHLRAVDIVGLTAFAVLITGICVYVLRLVG
jgi:hypothetical protein